MTDTVAEYSLTQLIHLTYDDIKKLFDELSLDKLKEICSDSKLVLKKRVYKNGPDRIIYEKNYILAELLTVYNKNRDIICRLDYVELMDLCRTHKLIAEDCRGLSKDLLIHCIISTVYVKNKLIKHTVILDPCLTPDTIEQIRSKTTEVVKPSELDEAKTKLEELRREKEAQEKLIKTQEKLLEDKIVKMKKKEEADEKKRIEAEKKRLEKEAEAEKKRIETEAEKKEKKRLEEVALLSPPPYEELEQGAGASATTAKNRKPLPSCVRDSVWNHYIGEDINKHRCMCCKKVLISNRRFEVGHVLSVKEGGTDEINNLRPICSPCNHSMGTKNMIDFVKTYGYYIG